MRIQNMLLGFFLFGVMACKNAADKQAPKTQAKFDKEKWVMQRDGHFLYRDMMLDDFIKNVKIKGLRRAEVFNMLGEPSRIDSNYLFYTVSKKHLGNTMIVLHSKTLVIKLGTDSTVEWRKIHD